jgi:hypothetical protein
MSLKPTRIPPILEDTAHLAHAVFPHPDINSPLENGKGKAVVLELSPLPFLQHISYYPASRTFK